MDNVLTSMPLPTGTITFLFTDIGDSTPKWERMPRQMQEALAEHDRILKDAVESCGGSVFKSLGDGICAAFEKPDSALDAAIDAQKSLNQRDWGALGRIEVRMGIHSGAAEIRDGDYFGSNLSRVARIMSLAHPGQILISQASAELLSASIDRETRLLPLGSVTLKGLSRPENVHQIAHPELPSDFPPLKTGVSPNNLPAELSLFIGREVELQQLLSATRRSRMVSITGSGGSGKTRLAIEAGRECVALYPDGVWLVELAPLADPDSVASEVASVLSVLPTSDRGMLDELALHLKPKSLMLILDNCEHLLDISAQLAQRLLKAAPGLHILATSREALGVPGETAVRIPSMAVPNEAESLTVDDLRRYDASNLFLQRATEANSALTVEGAACSTVAQICRRLDGIPLALELAASRLRAMPLTQLASRLDDRFHLLTGGSRTAVSRQRTLRALIDWSYDLLSPEEQSVLRSLAVFAGGWTLEAAEHVAAGNGVTDADVLDHLSSLVEKSLVVCDTNSDGDGRYRMLETIRQYATDKAQDLGEAESIRNRLLDYFYVAVKEAREKQQLFARLGNDWENIRAGIEWAIIRRDSRSFSLLDWLSGFLEASFRHHEGIDLTERSLKACNPFDDAKVAASACVSAGNLALRQREYELVEHYIVKAKELYANAGDEIGQVIADGLLFSVDLNRNQFEQAQSRLDYMLKESQRLGDPYILARSHYLMMLFRREQGNVDAVEALLEPTESYFGQAELPQWQCWTRVYGGWVQEARGHFAEAAHRYGQAMKDFRDFENNLGVIWQWECIARICSSIGRFAPSATLYGAAAAQREAIRWPLQRNEVAKNEAAAERAKEALGEAYDTHFRAGRSKTLEEASEFAFAQVEALTASP